MKLFIRAGGAVGKAGPNRIEKPLPVFPYRTSIGVNRPDAARLHPGRTGKIPALNIDYRFSNDKITVERQGEKGEWP